MKLKPEISTYYYVRPFSLSFSVSFSGFEVEWFDRALLQYKPGDIRANVAIQHRRGKMTIKKQLHIH